MKKITKKDLESIEKRMTEAAKSGDLKRWTFLAATYNRYSKELGLKKKYTWYAIENGKFIEV